MACGWTSVTTTLDKGKVLCGKHQEQAFSVCIAEVIETAAHKYTIIVVTRMDFTTYITDGGQCWTVAFHYLVI